MSATLPSTSRTRVLCAAPVVAVTAALLLAGLAAGALAPTVAALTPWAPAATLALLLALAGWLARGGAEPIAARLAVAAGSGALAGLLLAGPAGLAHAVLGLGVGVALRREGRGAGAALLDALPVAAGALLGGVLAGALGATPAVAALAVASPEAGATLLMGAVALGVAGGEVTRHLVVVRAAPPAWIAELARACEVEAPAAHAVLSVAIDAHEGAITALDEARLDARATREAALLARDLLAATATAATEARRMTQAGAALSRPPAVQAQAELEAARARIGASLEARRDAALEEAGRHAAALGRLAASLVDRGADRGRPLDLAALERRASALELRLEPKLDLELGGPA